MADFQFNAGRVGGVHVGTVATADELAGKLEELAISPEEKAAVMGKFNDAQKKYMSKDEGKKAESTPEKKGGAGKTLFDAVKKMMQ